MEAIKNQAAEIQKLTGGEEHSFFGYYDVQAWDYQDKRHLCHKVEFMDRMPGPEDEARLGFVDRDTGSFTLLDTTTAWCFQQGAFLQWNPAGSSQEVFYNIREGETFKCRIKNIETLEVRELERPAASLSPNGRQALSINFSRMYDFRPGYGYAGPEDLWKGENRPEQDGIFTVDTASGKSRLILSLAQIGAFLDSHKSPVARGKLLINHINFNTDGTRFVFLARNFPEPGGSGWGTAVITANADGTGLYLLNDQLYASHYHYRDPDHFLIHAQNHGGAQLYLLEDKSGEARIVDSAFFLKDGHCSYSPDRSWILYDSYPDENSYRHLYLYHIKSGRGKVLASLYSYAPSITDIRCDLHPRWNRSGTAISFDSNHENHRHVYTMELQEVMGFLETKD